MKHVILHDLGLPRARQVALAAWQSYSTRYERYHPSLTWEGETRARLSFEARGVRLAGVVQLGAEAIELDFEVPFLLRVFSGRAAEVIDREVQKWLEQARSGAL